MKNELLLEAIIIKSRDLHYANPGLTFYGAILILFLQIDFVQFVDPFPVDYIEKSFDVFWSSVLVFEVIGVFPDVNSKNRGLA